MCNRCRKPPNSADQISQEVEEETEAAAEQLPPTLLSPMTVARSSGDIAICHVYELWLRTSTFIVSQFYKLPRPDCQ